MTIEKIRKVKAFRRADITRIATEVATISGLMADPIQAMQSSFNVHKVPVGGIPFMVADAKSLNRHNHQSGRGNMRYLFDLQNRSYVGLAQEIDNGNYRRIA